jgi:pimeloyl-ACP methyl ester carboxylesterase
MIRSLTFLFIVVGSAFLLISCSFKEDELPIDDNVTLISATKVNSFTALEIRFALELSGYDIPSSAIQYDVDVYNVAYRTRYKGTDVTASGIISVPDTGNPLPMISLHHGTIVKHADAPTEQSSSLETVILFAAMAAPGFIAVVPDYLGFGSSTQVLHPYYVEEYMASSIVDNLKAAKELANELGKTFMGDLYLAGYSEGGYATMAAHKSIELNGLTGFNLVASFPAAGGYDVKAFQENYFEMETYDDPYYVAYVSMAYHNAFDWTEPLTDFFNEPYASVIPTLFDGTKSGGEINSLLSDTVSVLINPGLIDSLDIAPRYQYIADALVENSLTDWAPTIKMYMYHGDADTTVPYQNSVSTYQQFLDNGASTSTVELITLPGATHSSGLEPYIEDFVGKLLDISDATN